MTAGGWRIVPHWESGEKEVGEGDEEVDISGVRKQEGKCGAHVMDLFYKVAKKITWYQGVGGIEEGREGRKKV